MTEISINMYASLCCRAHLRASIPPSASTFFDYVNLIHISSTTIFGLHEHCHQPLHKEDIHQRGVSGAKSTPSKSRFTDLWSISSTSHRSGHRRLAADNEESINFHHHCCHIIHIYKKTKIMSVKHASTLATLIGRTPKGSYSPRRRSRHLLETPFSEPLLRTLLRTLFHRKTCSRPPSQNPSENPSPEPLECCVDV